MHYDAQRQLPPVTQCLGAGHACGGGSQVRGVAGVRVRRVGGLPRNRRSTQGSREVGHVRPRVGGLPRVGVLPLPQRQLLKLRCQARCLSVVGTAEAAGHGGARGPEAVTAHWWWARPSKGRWARWGSETGRAGRPKRGRSRRLVLLLRGTIRALLPRRRPSEARLPARLLRARRARRGAHCPAWRGKPSAHGTRAAWRKGPPPELTWRTGRSHARLHARGPGRPHTLCSHGRAARRPPGQLLLQLLRGRRAPVARLGPGLLRRAVALLWSARGPWLLLLLLLRRRLAVPRLGTRRLCVTPSAVPRLLWGTWSRWPGSSEARARLLHAWLPHTIGHGGATRPHRPHLTRPGGGRAGAVPTAGGCSRLLTQPAGAPRLQLPAAQGSWCTSERSTGGGSS
mmetsp:Transcript_8050/g.23855  ORF Transcript_8050/g.23855 Transcript_8050/m.23855 type:complete len:398 (+) Transcript_8050:2190-3383(+)